LAVGLFALALFAFLAAVYLTLEADSDALRDDFRRRALRAAIAVGATALLSVVTIGQDAALFRARFFGSPWTWPLQLVTAASAIVAIVCLVQRRYGLARIAAIAQVSLILLGWGLAQYPYLVAPDITIQAAAAPNITLRLLAPALLLGSILLFPSLYFLMRIFKTRPKAS
jgi:cytochrome d ubiquinol oxidase subunit II